MSPRPTAHLPAAPALEPGIVRASGRMPTESPLTRAHSAAAIAVIVLLIWPTWIAALNGLSDLYARPAIDYLEGKSLVDFDLSSVEWQAIEESVAQAHRMMPGNPEYLEALGFLSQIEPDSVDGESRPVKAGASAIDAEFYFLKALENRPTWSYYWANIALEQYRQGRQNDENFSFALANAARFAPWQNDTQLLVIDLGSRSLPNLSPGAYHEFILSLERGLHGQPENAIKLVSNAGAWPAVCAARNAQAIPATPFIRAYCSQTAAIE